MNEIERDKYEKLSGLAVEAHALGNFQFALHSRLCAYNLTTDGSRDRAITARDLSASYDRFGNLLEAQQYADESYRYFDARVQQADHPDRDALRERSVSAMYVVIGGLRRVVAARRAGYDAHAPNSVGLMRQSRHDIGTAMSLAPRRIDRFIDQYQINIARRAAAAEAIDGNRLIGIWLGAKAIALAVFSESPLLSTASPGFALRSRQIAKLHAAAGGLLAVGANVLGTQGTGSRQRLGLRLANRAL